MTLSEIAHWAKIVDKKLGNLNKYVATREEFAELENDLNHLQSEAPNSAAVRLARRVPAPMLRDALDEYQPRRAF